DEDPIGRRFNFITEPFRIEVVGIAEDTVSFLGQPRQPIIYLPHKQRFSGAFNLMVRSHQDPAAVLMDVQNVIRNADRAVPVTNVQTVRQAMGQALQAPRMGAALLGTFGLMALLLATVGIYGVMSYSVSRRTQEIGIRTALGARASEVRALVVRQGMTLVAVGLAAGLGLALAASQVVQSLLFGISSVDIVAYGGNSLLLLLVALLACLIPAQRAARVDPIVALRNE
ncbi:MAG: FtsX-like permease family protein, partial [Acidobacteriota bacterium]